MPGRGNAYNGSKHHWVLRYFQPLVWLGVILVTIFHEVWGMTRFYYWRKETRHCNTSIAFTVFYVFMDFMVFTSLIVCKNSDPGYLIPIDKEAAEERAKIKMAESIEAKKKRKAERKARGAEDTSGSADTHPEDRVESGYVCKRCGLEREHNRVSHCGRCNRCVNYMDHHCVFTDNCVGMLNYKYYFCFIFWGFGTLSVSIMLLLFNFYTKNVEEDYGA